MLSKLAELRPSIPPLPEARHWVTSLVLATTFALYAIAGLSVTSLTPVNGTANARVAAGLPTVSGLGTPPAAEPLRFREIAPQDALAINASVPVSNLPNPAARPFRASFASPVDRLRALECLTAAVYYEAAIEPLEGQRAVAQVVLNRVRHPAYPKTVCGVVFQGHERSTGCQFTFTCDGGIRRTPAASLWARARQIAEQALAGSVYAPVGWATHYHTNWVVPYWSSSLTKLANVGTHIFYRWEGGWGRPQAFRFNAAGSEPQMALMRHLTSDPSSLAQAEVLLPETIDAAAAAAAAAAGAPAPGQPGAPTGAIDSFQRAVLRRYEPMTKEAATAAAEARSDKPVTASTHWALSGLPQKASAPLGKKAEAAPATAEAKPAPPPCLDGVRRALKGVQGPADKQAGC
ncbi:MAG TPA: cell wall hydrolase [Allosphingosinicella sp.]|jgi:spore germination cell wall hydrolase CwlJ-like protein